MANYVLALLLLAGSLPGAAQEVSAPTACMTKARTQLEMNICASKEAAQADAQLDTTYRKLLSAARRREGLSEVEAAEAAWVAYSKAYIIAMYPAKNKQGRYGSMYAMGVDLLRAKLTRQQIAALEQLLQQYERP
jgi:uncharacterized protein YecT (DUF1311 family)